MTTATTGSTIKRTLGADASGATWTDELEGRPLETGTRLELCVRGRWVPVVYLRDSHTSLEGPRAYLRYQKGKKTVPLALEGMALRWPPPAPPAPERPHYTWWGDVPERLLTRTALRAEGLRPGGEPLATIRYGRRGRYQETVLYDRAQAVPRKEATPAQLAALEKATEVRDQNTQRRRLEEAAEIEREEAEWQAWLVEQAEEGRAALREIVGRGRWLSLDTETTELENPEVIEVALVSPAGEVLFESLVRPLGPVSEGARQVHGITDEELAGAPTWPEVYAQLVPLIGARELVAWNAGFDRQALARSSALHGLTWPEGTWHCAMEWGAQTWGEYSERRGSFRWVSLDAACRSEGVRVDARHHRAAGDGRRLSALLNAVARRPAP